VQTLEGHAQNVAAVAFHPELPIILTGSEDGEFSALFDLLQVMSGLFELNHLFKSLQNILDF